MSDENDLLNDFLADINTMEVGLAEKKELKNDVIITTTQFAETSDPAILAPKEEVKKVKKSEYDAYQKPVFAEVDPEAKRIERLEKFHEKEKKEILMNKKHYRQAGDQTWVDPTYPTLWGENDFRIFVGNLSRDVSDEILANIFRQRYTSFQRARVIPNKCGRGSMGYGFVSFSDPFEGVKAIKEMNGKLCGSRPMKIMKSKWEEKEASVISLF